MTRDEIYEIARLNKRLSRNIAALVDFIVEKHMKDIDQLQDVVSYLIKIDQILRSMNYEE